MQLIADRLVQRHGDLRAQVAVPEIAFAPRRCNKTGHNEQ
jgi:hypothetical protein